MRFNLSLFKVIIINVFYHIKCCRAADASFGPFVCELQRIENCKDPSTNVTSEPTVSFDAEIYEEKQKRLIRGNITLLEGAVDYKMDMMAFKLENGRYVQYFYAKKMSCRQGFTQQLYTLLNIKFTKRTCVYKPGVYSFKGIDIDMLTHAMVSMRHYLTEKWRLEIFSRKGLELCVDIIGEIKPLHNKT